MSISSSPSSLTPTSSSTSASYLLLTLVIVAVATYLYSSLFHTRSTPINQTTMSRATSSKSNQLLAEFKEITGATTADATRILKKHKTLEGAIEAFYSDPAAQAHASTSGGGKDRSKGLGDVWEKFKDPNSKTFGIESTMAMCEALEIDPSSDAVLFCLSTDLGSKVMGEFEKQAFVSGWSAMPGNIDSVQGMKERLPGLRTKLWTEPAYFKKVYMHTFELSKAPGARVLALDVAIPYWQLYIPPALSSRPSALARIPPPGSSSSSTDPAFTLADLEYWIEFQTIKDKAVSKDTWSLFIDFIRSIDGDFKEYDEGAAWPSTIDDFVEFAREKKGTN